MCSPVAAVGVNAGLGLAQSYAGYQGQQAQYQAQVGATRARNRAALNQYHYNIQRQNQEWAQTRQVWDQRIQQYHQQIQRNYEAAYGMGGAYQGTQRKVNEAFEQAAFQQQDSLVRLQRTLGAGAATGQSGVSVDRFDTASLAAFGREQALRTSNLVRAREGKILDDLNYRRQLESANNQAWQSVSVAPQPGMRPMAPTMQAAPAAPSGFSFMVDAGKTAFQAAGGLGLFGADAQANYFGIQM